MYKLTVLFITPIIAFMSTEYTFCSGKWKLDHILERTFPKGKINHIQIVGSSEVFPFSKPKQNLHFTFSLHFHRNQNKNIFKISIRHLNRLLCNKVLEPWIYRLAIVHSFIVVRRPWFIEVLYISRQKCSFWEICSSAMIYVFSHLVVDVSFPKSSESEVISFQLLFLGHLRIWRHVSAVLTNEKHCLCPFCFALTSHQQTELERWLDNIGFIYRPSHWFDYTSFDCEYL